MSQLTDEQIKAIAQQWFVTGENQLRADGYYYRSLGTVTNVRESDLIAFAREVLARAEAWPAIREAITKEVMPNIRAFQHIRALQQRPEPPPECETEEEKRAFAFGWWKAMEANRAGGTGAYAFGVRPSPDLLQMLHECAEYIAALNGEQDDYCQRARALIARATGEVK